MNTPAHLVLNALALGRGRWRNRWLPIGAGALVPDLPMLGFYAYQRGVAGVAEAVIWSETYFRPDWQMFFDLFNSIPLVALGALVAWRSGSTAWLAFFASMGLHCLADLPLHHDDAHAHFRPLTTWRFESPISYWDARHYGHVFAALELLGALAGGLWLVVRRRTVGWRALGGGALVAYALGAAYALAVWR